ncbi:protein-associating with the carboxyl-terminal domain of ezrin isoform X2 [Copidosoma floridanum]|uniref:protein-associating with the carboxyl-terminal domain of ezrin isoform X2 n=1 Tax=Copidosoma floridanum TaxID=29053 RepID=UPI0006C9C6C1|nr:protein-associating with the carboxyl-terminal domain of ezrin isoform X2 [Copidosoma floridanum]
MGNDSSALKGLEIGKAVEITDSWSLHNASIGGQNTNPQCLSIFISEPSLHSDPSFGRPTPLEKNAKFVSSWSKGSMFYFVSEEVKPLEHVIRSQTTLEICIGLNNILKALLFLHENASGSHNNVCSTSVYVTTEGSWKLGGLECFCKHSELKESYLKKIKTYRYKNAISPMEDTWIQDTSDFVVIDKYAFAVLADEVLGLKNNDDVPGLSEFKDLCKKKFQDTSLSALASHPFFVHDFMNIHSFLMELPLKNDSEKEHFFLNLVPQLKNFPEKIVAEQLGKLLLSRMVLLDETAQTKLLPFILKPKDKDEDPELLTLATFQAYLVPRLLQMFCVRDTPIRLLLLSHLSSFVKAFQVKDLKHRVLPELLVGIKDTNDYLVSMTLHALANIVPILGGAAVIGGNRGKLFTDGRPKSRRSKKNLRVTFSTPSEMESIEPNNINITSECECLPERPSPDGGEDKEEATFTFAEEENWSDWDSHEASVEDSVTGDSLKETRIVEEELKNTSLSISKSKNYPRKKPISDISELDIKVSPSVVNVEEIDFFSDMEPVIQKAKVLHIDTTFNFHADLAPKADDTEDGWGDDLDGWNVENNLT